MPATFERRRRPGGVDQDDPPALELQLGVDRVAGGSRPLGDDQPIGAEEGVDEGGLADVGAADHRDAGRVVVKGRALGALPQQIDQAIEQVPGAEPMGGRDGERLAEAELVELGAEVGISGPVGLVGDDHDRGIAAAQGLCQLGVTGAQPGARVDDHHHRVRLGDREPRLALHVAGQLGLIVEIDPPGVHKLKGDPVPLAGKALAVAGDARLGRRHRLAAANQAVDQGALADVGEADDGDGGQPGTHASPRSRASSTTSATTSASARAGGIDLHRVLGDAQGAVLALDVARIPFPLGGQHLAPILARSARRGERPAAPRRR